MKISDYFDKTFIVCSLNSKKAQHTVRCLKELGLYDDSVMQQLFMHCNDIPIICQNAVPSDFHEYMYRLSGSLTQYTIVKHCYESGLNSVLILEDDNYFLNDIEKWETILDNIPNDYDVIRFSGFIFSEQTDFFMFENNFAKYDTINDAMFSSSAFALSRNGMKAYLRSQEASFRASDHVNDIFITRKNDPYNLYTATHVGGNSTNIYVPEYCLMCPFDDIENYREHYVVCHNYVPIKNEDYF